MRNFLFSSTNNPGIHSRYNRVVRAQLKFMPNSTKDAARCALHVARLMKNFCRQRKQTRPITNNANGRAAVRRPLSAKQ